MTRYEQLEYIMAKAQYHLSQMGDVIADIERRDGHPLRPAQRRAMELLCLHHVNVWEAAYHELGAERFYINQIPLCMN